MYNTPTWALTAAFTSQPGTTQHDYLRCLVPPEGVEAAESGLRKEPYTFIVTIRQQSSMGPTMAPSSPMQNIPPAMARPVMYG